MTADKLVIVHNPVNKGLGAARDAGMKAASGEYIGFIDSDDYIKPDFISRYIEAFRSSLSDVVAGGYIRDENGKYTELPSVFLFLAFWAVHGGPTARFPRIR